MPYAIPEDTDPDKVIRITIVPGGLLPCDICMDFNPWYHFWNVCNFNFDSDQESHEELFRLGYEDAKKNRQIFVNKGLKPLQQPQGSLRKHLKTIRNFSILSPDKTVQKSWSHSTMTARDIRLD